MSVIFIQLTQLINISVTQKASQGHSMVV
jgi:hypothetical protein